MPNMYEIYESNASEYHELVCAEDFQENLSKALHTLVNFQNTRVLEAGVGTGRVTQIYIDDVARATCCDRSGHMLDFARDELSPYGSKITFSRIENLDLPILAENVDVFIEGWSFGHTVSDADTPEDQRIVIRSLVEAATKNVRPNGWVIFIETLGTNTDIPNPPTEKLALLYRELENTHGFHREQIRTDYQFETNEDAVRVMGFFFGSAMARRVKDRGMATIPEWTGIWLKQLSPG